MAGAPLTYRITTLGCRVNHAETRELESILLERGLTRAGDGHPADLEVVHTCSVTNAAAAKSRHAIRRARRRQPTGVDGDAVRAAEHLGHGGGTSRSGAASKRGGRGPSASPEVIVTGCYAGTHPQEAAALSGAGRRIVPPDAGDGRDLVDRFTRQVEAWLGSRPVLSALRPEASRSSAPAAAEPLPPPLVSLPLVSLPLVSPPLVSPPAHASAGRHVRAEVRIQEGCDAHCTFCIIPRVRRTLRSKRLADVVAETRRLVELGHREIVLAGIFLGAYGHETALRRRQRDPSAAHLAELVDAVARVPGLARLRLSSLEPGDVTGALLDAMVASAPVVVPHLHLPLQSGSDVVLRRMNRQYAVGEYLEMIDRVEEALTCHDGPGDPLPPAITTDVICGFPGETDADFARTVEVARRVGFLHMHVFPFSPRAGTAAARWTGDFVPAPVRAARVRTLIDLEEDAETGLSIRYRRRLLGRRVRVILEQPARADDGTMTGRCDHYALVHLRTSRRRGEVVAARVTGVDADRTRGESDEVTE